MVCISVSVALIRPQSPQGLRKQRNVIARYILIDSTSLYMAIDEIAQIAHRGIFRVLKLVGPGMHWGLLQHMF